MGVPVVLAQKCEGLYVYMANRETPLVGVLIIYVRGLSVNDRGRLCLLGSLWIIYLLRLNSSVI